MLIDMTVNMPPIEAIVREAKKMDLSFLRSSMMGSLPLIPLLYSLHFAQTWRHAMA
jgi:hypothetical protein